MNESLNIACPFCGESGKTTRIYKDENVEVRGVEISVTKVSRECSACSVQYESTKDHDWKKEAFDKYRAVQGIPSSENIREWRREYDLTQADVSSLLGWGEATIGRYEKGSLPTEAQCKQLVSIMTEEGLFSALEEKPESIDYYKRLHLIDRMRPNAVRAKYKKIIQDIYSTSNEIFNGGRDFAFDKAAGLVSLLCEHRETVTKFNKLMFYADFLAKRELGHSITGIQYARIKFGPVPENYGTLYDCMKEINVIDIDEVTIFIHPAQVISPVELKYRDNLTDEEAGIAIKVREHFKKFNASEIADYSHLESAWIEVNNKDHIPYSYAEDLSISP